MGIDPVSLAITVALNAATMAMTMSRTIEGPRLSDLTATVADYGTPLNYFYGKRRLECPCFFTEPIREVKKKRKTKGGKYKEYTYFGTWAIAIADHAIETVSRIWFDRHLVYDRTGSGPSSVFELKDGYELDEAMRIYLGTETQEPDARITTYIEGEEGADTAPAYRGVAYLMFEDIPLEKMGNRLPQVSVEAITASSPIYPAETYATIISQPSRLWGFTYSPDFSRFMWSFGTTYEIWDAAARARMISGTFPVTFALQGTFGISNNGTIYGRVGSSSSLDQSVVGVNSDGVGLVGTLFLMGRQENIRLLEDGNGHEHIITFPTATITYFYTYSLTTFASVVQVDTADIGDGSIWSAKCAIVDSYGDIWVSGSYNGVTADDLFLYRVVNVSGRTGSDFFHINSGNNSFDPGTEFSHYNGHFIVHWGGSRLFKIDDETGVIVLDVSKGGDTFNNYKQWANLPPGSSSIWLNASEVSLDDLSTIRTVTLSNWAGADADGIIYDPINHALITVPQFDPEITFRFLDRVSSDGVMLQTIVEDVSDRVDVTGNDIDASDLTQTVKGYSWTQGQAKQIIAPLLELYDADARPHNFSVEFLNRG